MHSLRRYTRPRNYSHRSSSSRPSPSRLLPCRTFFEGRTSMRHHAEYIPRHRPSAVGDSLSYNGRYLRIAQEPSQRRLSGSGRRVKPLGVQDRGRGPGPCTYSCSHLHNTVAKFNIPGVDYLDRTRPMGQHVVCRVADGAPELYQDAP